MLYTPLVSCNIRLALLTRQRKEGLWPSCALFSRNRKIPAIRYDITDQ
jgi:hypothetical protein